MVGQADGERVGFKVVDGDEGFAGAEGDCLCEGESGEQAADQAGAGGGGDEVDALQRDCCFSQGLTCDRGNAFDMGASCDFRNDAAECAVFGPLGTHDVGEDLAPAGTIAADQRNGCFIAARLDAEDEAGRLVGRVNGCCVGFEG